MVKRYGWEWMDKYSPTARASSRAISASPRDLGRRKYGDDRLPPESFASRKHADKPPEIAFSETDPTPIWAQTAATFKDSPHPNAARLFLSWFLQKEQQTKQIDTWSVRVDVPPPDGMPPVFSLMLANRYAEFLATRP